MLDGSLDLRELVHQMLELLFHLTKGGDHQIDEVCDRQRQREERNQLEQLHDLLRKVGQARREDRRVGRRTEAVGNGLDAVVEGDDDVDDFEDGDQRREKRLDRLHQVVVLDLKTAGQRQRERVADVRDLGANEVDKAHSALPRSARQSGAERAR